MSNPTTTGEQEWTEGRVFAYFETEDFKGLAGAINTALAAEEKAFRENVEHAIALIGDRHAAEIHKLSNQLAAEREERKIIERSREAWKSQVTGLTKALAAEQSELLSYITTHEADANYIQQLREQQQELVDALKQANYFVRKAGATNTADSFDELLAKVKEGKS